MASIMRTPAVVRANGDARRQMTTYGWFSFDRTGTQVPYKCELTRDWLTVVTCDPLVTAVSKRVNVLQWYDGQKWRTHIPRYAVHYRDGGREDVLLVDVEWSWEERALEERTRRLKLQADEMNLAYGIFSENSIRLQPRLHNATLIGWHAARDSVDLDAVDAVARFADAEPWISVAKAVAAGVAPYDRAYEAVLHLVAHGRLRFPLSRAEFGPDTRVTRRRSRA